jgi:hypothetical protein
MNPAQQGILAGKREAAGIEEPTIALNDDDIAAMRHEIESLRRELAEVVSEHFALRQAAKLVRNQLAGPTAYDEDELVEALNRVLAETESR